MAGAWRVHHGHIPVSGQNVANVADDMARAGVLGGQDVAGPCVMPQRGECATDNAGTLTTNQYAHLILSICEPRQMAHACRGAPVENGWTFHSQ
jgi:hypothetical protein